MLSMRERPLLLSCSLRQLLACRIHDKATLLLLLLLLLRAVVFDGSDLVGVDETRPYTARPMDYYTGTNTACCPCRWHASVAVCLLALCVLHAYPLLLVQMQRAALGRAAYHLLCQAICQRLMFNISCCSTPPPHRKHTSFLLLQRPR
jgi:hypothetical protein